MKNKTLSKDKSWLLARRVALEVVPLLNPQQSIKEKLLKALRDNDGATLANMAVKPSDYDSAFSYRNDAQSVDLLRKFPYLPSGIETAEVAKKGFRDMEHRCGIINDALLERLSSPKNEDDFNFARTLHRARRLIVQILGRAPNLSKLNFAFGPGATSQCRSGEAKSKKYARKVHCTSRLAEAWLANASDAGPIIPLRDSWGFNPTIRNYERITTVLKTAKTDRTIGVPVHLNAFVQRGIGLAIRDRLDKYIGINLSEVPEYHALLAGVAHVDGLSTIDLSSASDTICYTIIKELLPLDWFKLMLLARVDYYELDSEMKPYEKFSAMGNGFTFELETLVFYALAVVASADDQDDMHAVKHNVSVFGDDIIVKRSAAKRVVTLLEASGFMVNSDKTFLDGAFFESCGSDFYNGIAVRSLYLKDLRTPQDVIMLYNMIITLSQRAVDGLHRDKRFQKITVFLESVLKTWFAHDFSVCRVPSGYTHGLVSSFDEAKPYMIRSSDTSCNQWSASAEKRVKSRRLGWQGWQLKYCQFVPFTHDSSESELGLDRWLYERSHVPIQQRRKTLSDWAQTEVCDPMTVSTESLRKRGRYCVGKTIHFSEWVGPGMWI